MRGSRTVVIVPCYNEALTIARVVSDFKRELPEADVIVLDNNSTDGSAEIAKDAGASVVKVPVQGKGAVMRSAFRAIDADIYVMVDGDDTYSAACVHDLVEHVREGRADMAMGDRLSEGVYASQNKRHFHNFGNSLVCALVNNCFKSGIRDVMTGYRVFSRRFAKSVPVLSRGFELETEMTVRCLDRCLPIVEIPVGYKDRPQGSFSKLNTFKDGFRVIKIIFSMLKDYRPLFFFGSLALVALVAGFMCGLPVIMEYVRERYITHVPLAILATGFILAAMTFLSCAFILDTMVSHERQKNELAILRFEGKSLGVESDSEV